MGIPSDNKTDTLSEKTKKTIVGSMHSSSAGCIYRLSQELDLKPLEI